MKTNPIVRREVSSSRKPKDKSIALVPMSHAQEMALLSQQVAVIHSSPSHALNFLKRAGLVTPTGQVRRLVRD